MKNSFIHISCVLITLSLYCGCREEANTPTLHLDPLIVDASKGPVELTITVNPPKVFLDKGLLLTIKVRTPSEIDVQLPSIDDRLQGFIFDGEYGGEPSTHDGFTTIEQHIRLSPVISDEYRLAPMPIVYIDNSKSPAVSSWFPTEPIVFESVSPITGKPKKDITTSMKPHWIYPSFKTVAIYSLLVLCIAGGGILMWIFARKIHREVKLRQMSPRERALLELEELLAKHLPEQNMTKQFYVELTMIVRRYIERNHNIKAPEQTTEEFLQAVSHDSRFSNNTLTTLKSFLEAADLVKFAAYQPSDDSIVNATNTAKNYIKTDSQETDTASRRHL